MCASLSNQAQYVEQDLNESSKSGAKRSSNHESRYCHKAHKPVMSLAGGQGGF